MREMSKMYEMIGRLYADRDDLAEREDKALIRAEKAEFAMNYAKKEIKRLEEENDLLKTGEEARDTLIESYQKDIERLENDRDHWRKVGHGCTEKIDKMGAEIESLEGQLKLKKIGNEVWREHCEEAEQRARELEWENEDLKTKIKSLEWDIETLQAENEELKLQGKVIRDEAIVDARREEDLLNDMMGDPMGALDNLTGVE